MELKFGAKMNISKMCQECVKYRIDDCAGKATRNPGKLPCRKYELDPQLISDQDIEPDSPPPSLKREQKSKPLIPAPVLPTDAKKAANFERLAVKRLRVLLDGFRKLSNLGNKANYEWTCEQVDVMIGRIRSAADDLEKKFQK